MIASPHQNFADDGISASTTVENQPASTFPSSSFSLHRRGTNKVGERGQQKRDSGSMMRGSCSPFLLQQPQSGSRRPLATAPFCSKDINSCSMDTDYDNEQPETRMMMAAVPLTPCNLERTTHHHSSTSDSCWGWGFGGGNHTAATDDLLSTPTSIGSMTISTPIQELNYYSPSKVTNLTSASSTSRCFYDCSKKDTRTLSSRSLLSCSSSSSTKNLHVPIFDSISRNDGIGGSTIGIGDGTTATTTSIASGGRRLSVSSRSSLLLHGQHHQHNQGLLSPQNNLMINLYAATTPATATSVKASVTAVTSAPLLSPLSCNDTTATEEQQDNKDTATSFVLVNPLTLAQEQQQQQDSIMTTMMCSSSSSLSQLQSSCERPTQRRRISR